MAEPRNNPTQVVLNKSKFVDVVCIESDVRWDRAGFWNPNAHLKAARVGRADPRLWANDPRSFIFGDHCLGVSVLAPNRIGRALTFPLSVFR